MSNYDIYLIICGLAEKENVNEKIKNDNQLLLIGLMNNKKIVLKNYFLQTQYNFG